MKRAETCLEEDADPKLALEVLADLAGVKPCQVASRETIRARPSKVTERIEISADAGARARAALLKWGSSPRLVREILLYASSYDPEVDPVPRMLAYRVLDDRQLVLLEWVEGTVPDLSKRDIVERVFRDYGRWAGRWSGLVCSYLAGETGPFWRPVPPALQPELVRMVDRRITEEAVIADLERAHERFLACADLLGPIHGWEKRALFRDIAESAAAVAEAIFSTPATLTSVDLSAKNMLLRPPAHRPIFFDFEHGGICPAALTLGRIGEASELTPSGSLGERAKEAFLDGWSTSASAPLAREVFRRSQRCARLYLQCHDLNHFLERILSDPDLLQKPPWRDWWPRTSSGLTRLVRAVERDIG